MKYLVTGGAGFIGANLVESLLKKEHEVIVLDNLSTGSLKNLEAVKNQIFFIEAAVKKVLEIREIKNLGGIFHLGIPSTTMLYRQNRFLVGESVDEFIRVLELAKRENCKLVYTSSSSIYNGNSPPFREDMPILVKDFYTEARYLMEKLAKLYYEFYKVKSIGFRLFSVYGPHEETKKEFANLVSQFLWAMKNNESPVIYGDGTQTRDFIYIEDVIKGLILGMNSNIDCDIFNLGTGESYSINELVDILNEVLDKNIKAKYIQNPIQNYVKETLADAKKAEKILDFKARISLREGVEKLFFFKK